MHVTPLERGFPRRKPRDPGIVAMLLAIAFALVLGTVGYFLVGFATLTSCTNAYSCTQTSCAPCQTAGNWLLTGAGLQGALAIVGAVFLVLALSRARLRKALILVAIAITVCSLLAITATKGAAELSFCQGGGTDYDDGCANAD